MGAIFAAFITGIVALVVGLVAGGFSLINTWRLNKKDAEIEKLKAELSHGQVVRKAQWDVEFGAYQGIWRGMVSIRTLVPKMVYSDQELTELGIPEDFEGRMKNKQDG